MFLFQAISVLLISIMLYTYLGNNVFLCDLGFKQLPSLQASSDKVRP